MKKVLLAVAAVLGIGAGGYYLFPQIPQDQINKYAKFLPEPVAAFLITEEVTSDELVSLTEDDAITDAPPVQDLSQLQASEGVNVAVEENAFVEESAVQQVEPEATSNSSSNEVVETVSQVEVETNKQTETITTPVEAVSNNKVAIQNASPEVSKLLKELEEVKESIATLDSQNVVLEERFQRILKKNRDLAIQLKKINEQIDSIN